MMDEQSFVTMENYDKRYAYGILAILSALVLIVMYIEGMLTPSLPSIAQSFGVNVAQVSLVLSAYLVTGVALSPIVGKMGDLLGKKKIMTAVLIIYAVCVSITGFSPDFYFMVIARAFQGIGITILPLGMSIMREQFPRDMIPKSQALLSAMFGVGFAISLPLGAFISNDYGWRMTYHTSIPFIIILTIISVLYIKESRFRRPEVKIDFTGSAILAISLAMIVIALSEGSLWGWTSTLFLSVIFTGFIFLIPMYIYEKRYLKNGGEPVFDFPLLKERNVMVPNFVLALSGLGMFLAMQALSYRFETPKPYGFGLDILDTGLSLVPFALGLIFLAPITARASIRFGVKPVAVIGSVVTAIGFLFESSVSTFYVSLVYEFFIGAGLSILNASVINLLILTVSSKNMALATSMNSTFRSLGSTLGAPIAGAVLSAFTISVVVSGNHIFSFPDNTSYHIVFVISSVVFLIAAVINMMGREVLGKRKYVGTGIKNPIETQSQQI